MTVANRRAAIVAGLCLVAGCVGPGINCRRFERYDFAVGAACLPDVVAAETPLDFLVYHSCADCNEFRDFECAVTVDGADVYVAATVEMRFDPNFCVGCSLAEGSCALPPLPSGSYVVHFEDSYRGQTWAAAIEVGAATGLPMCSVGGGLCPNTCE